MLTDAELKRQEVAAAYSTDSWKKKVRIMSDQQVIAVYLRLRKIGKIKI